MRLLLRIQRSRFSDHGIGGFLQPKSISALCGLYRNSLHVTCLKH